MYSLSCLYFMLIDIYIIKAVVAIILLLNDMYGDGEFSFTSGLFLHPPLPSPPSKNLFIILCY